MNELKNWVIDKLTYCNNYNPCSVCFGYSVYEINANRKVLTNVLEKIREIEEKERQVVSNGTGKEQME